MSSILNRMAVSLVYTKPIPQSFMLIQLLQKQEA